MMRVLISRVAGVVFMFVGVDPLVLSLLPVVAAVVVVVVARIVIIEVLRMRVESQLPVRRLTGG